MCEFAHSMCEIAHIGQKSEKKSLRRHIFFWCKDREKCSKRTKVFKERNTGQAEFKKTLSKQLTECDNQLKDVNVKFGLGSIPTEAYNATIESLKDKKRGLENELEKSKENLSNLEKQVGNVLAISSNLGSLWADSSFDIQQKLQSLLFPKGVTYNKEKHNYLTIKENNVFTVFRNLSVSYKEGKIKKELQNGNSFNVVAGTGLEPATSRL